VIALKIIAFIAAWIGGMLVLSLFRRRGSSYDRAEPRSARKNRRRAQK